MWDLLQVSAVKGSSRIAGVKVSHDFPHILSHARGIQVSIQLSVAHAVLNHTEIESTTSGPSWLVVV